MQFTIVITDTENEQVDVQIERTSSEGSKVDKLCPVEKILKQIMDTIQLGYDCTEIEGVYEDEIPEGGFYINVNGMVN